MDLNSSFGPFGSLKICHDNAGSILLTKDGNQLFEYQIRGKSLTCLADFLKFRSLSLAQANGDGFLATLIVTQSLSHSLLTDLRLKLSFVNVRINIVAVIAAISNVIARHWHVVVCQLVENRLWSSSCTKQFGQVLQALCFNLISSGSDKETAESLAVLISEWVMDTARRSQQNISYCCEYLLENVDNLQFSNYTFTDLTNSGMLVKNQVIIKGICKDYSALSSRALHGTACADGFTPRFICMQCLMEEREELAHVSASYTISSVSLNELVEASNPTMHSVLIRFVDLLRSQQIGTICCSVFLSDRTRNILLHNGLQIIEGVPSHYMQILARASHCPIFIDCYDFLEEFLNKDAKTGENVSYSKCSKQSDSLLRHCFSFGLYSHIKVIFLGNREQYLLVCGLRDAQLCVTKSDSDLLANNNDEDSSNHQCICSCATSCSTPSTAPLHFCFHRSRGCCAVTSSMPCARPLLLCTNSGLAAGQQSRLVRRCLRVMAVALRQGSSNRNSIDGSISNSSTAAVGGGGRGGEGGGKSCNDAVAINAVATVGNVFLRSDIDDSSARNCTAALKGVAHDVKPKSVCEVVVLGAEEKCIEYDDGDIHGAYGNEDSGVSTAEKNTAVSEDMHINREAACIHNGENSPSSCIATGTPTPCTSTMSNHDTRNPLSQFEPTSMHAEDVGETPPLQTRTETTDIGVSISSSDSIVVLPGGGAAEMTWAFLMLEVGFYIGVYAEINKFKASETARASRSCDDDDEQRTKCHTKLSPIAKEIALMILKELSVYGIARQASLLLFAKRQCEHIAMAYLQVPFRLLVSCSEVLYISAQQNLQLPQPQQQLKKSTEICSTASMNRYLSSCSTVVESDVCDILTSSVICADLASIYCMTLRVPAVFNHDTSHMDRSLHARRKQDLLKKQWIIWIKTALSGIVVTAPKVFVANTKTIPKAPKGEDEGPTTPKVDNVNNNASNGYYCRQNNSVPSLESDISVTIDNSGFPGIVAHKQCGEIASPLSSYSCFLGSPIQNGIGSSAEQFFRIFTHVLWNARTLMRHGDMLCVKRLACKTHTEVGIDAVDTAQQKKISSNATRCSRNYRKKQTSESDYSSNNDYDSDVS